ncbi:MAG: peptidylprolyl isomerase [Micavibrio aeruginosavorus]|uniref:Peptidylprolyl isomerase n=1 Tax=Micavibrio aeruginosavorus TaxID=349221 RepID=A0A7T5UIS8_9BACT|nr:MAG: peptidylprolyl isomerase [Micavibrio aeruginosavorus]
MMIEAPGITVNGVKITTDQINAEVQYHPAPSLVDAKYEAMQALVIRELLIQQAVSLGLCISNDGHENLDDVIEELLEREISVPEPDLETCQRYYDNNKKRFHTSPLFEVSHILYLAPPEDENAREKALAAAESALRAIQKDPSIFEDTARRDSACPSSAVGGSLGQIGLGQTLPAFESALRGMKEGELSAEPVLSSVGYHIIRLHKRIDGQMLPFEAVSEWIEDHLRMESWQRAFSQYIQILAGKAEISGFRFMGADSPLVQ